MTLRPFARWGASLALVLGALSACSTLPAPQTAAATGVQRLYVFNCGEGLAADVSRWSPGVNVGKPIEYVDSCYLIRHQQGWMLWDTGLADEVAAMPDGVPGPIHWRRPKSLAAQLAEVGVKPGDIRFVAVSHSHPDHIGNVGMFPGATLLVQEAEFDWPQASGPRFPPNVRATKLKGDRDVFGDGSVVVLSTPGHTPGHQSLLVRLPHTGALVLSGDAVHFRENWEARRVPSINFDKAQTLASMQRLADVIAREHAILWINHDKAQREGQKMAPAFYD